MISEDTSKIYEHNQYVYKDITVQQYLTTIQ